MRNVVKQLLLTNSFDPDALNYIKAVELADRQPLENNVKRAINIFVIGCKSDGIWNAIKTSCLLCGARTLLGALIPLKGTAPTNFNFISGDYNPKTGLKGNGLTKYLNSNRLSNADPQNNCHLSCYLTEAGSTGERIIGSGGNSTGALTLGANFGTNNYQARSRSSTLDEFSYSSFSPGFLGQSRSNNSNFSVRFNSVSQSRTRTSETASVNQVEVFRSEAFSTSARISFYSIGEAIDLVLLDTRLTTFMNTLNEVL